MQESNAYFATTPPVRLFFKASLPGMISMFAMSIYSIIEGAFIGRLVGEAAFAAINLAMPFVMINFSLADLIGVGSSVPISIALGQKNQKRANNYFSSALVLIFLTALVMGFVMFFGAPTLLRFMGAEGDMATLAVKYTRVYAIFSPLTTLVFAMDNYLRISGFVRFSMVLNIFMSCLTACLLYVFLGLVGMSVEGSALASCCSFVISACIGIAPFLMKKTVLQFTRPQFSKKMIREIVSCGAPVFLNNVSGRVASIAMNMALIHIGGQTAVAAYSVLMYAGELFSPLLYGMSDSMQPAIGYNWGAGAGDRVKKLAKCVFTGCATVSAISVGIMLCFPGFFVNLFVDSGDEILREMAVGALRLYSFTYLFRWFGFASQGFYSAIEKPLPASVLSLASAMVFPLLMLAILWPLGLNGLWLNQVGTQLLMAVLALIMMRRTQKQMKHKLNM